LVALPGIREMSVTEQRYKAVLAVIAHRGTITVYPCVQDIFQALTTSAGLINMKLSGSAGVSGRP
jgi:hypothetical protein